MATTSDRAVHEQVSRYYSKKIEQFGPTSRGVDWNSPVGQRLRFTQLLKVADGASFIDLADLGCGYGDLVSVLAADGRPYSYRGYDVSEAMIKAARTLHAGNESAGFEVAGEPLAPARFVVASGIFNVRMDYGRRRWAAYVKATLDTMNRNSEAGFSFNMLTSYSDSDRMVANLYYASPEHVFRYCKSNFSRNVALLHDYGLYEFTVIVRKEPA